VKFVAMKEKNEQEPVTDLGYLPTPFTAAQPALVGQYDDPALANVRTGGFEYHGRQNYRRHEIRGTFTQFFDTGGASHQLKAGGGYEFGEEDFHRVANGWGALVAQTVSGEPVIRARYYSQQPAQLGQGRTYGLFVQDNITIASRLSVSAGVLLNRDEFAQELEGSDGCPAVLLSGGAAVYDSSGDTCTFLRFGFGDEIQPRFGASYNLRDGSGDKLYANWGRYYNMDQKSSGRSLAPRRIFQNQAFFDLTGRLISDGPLASTTGKLIDPDIEPIYSDEFLVGYSTPIDESLSIDLFLMHRDMKRFIEDVPSRISDPTDPDAGPYAAANLPCSRFESCRLADAERTYTAFSVELARRLSDGWSANVSYTWSRFEGNFDIDTALVSSFNTSSFIQDGPGTNVEEPNRFGPLRQDRPHVFKVFGSWMPREPLTVGGYFRVQSGAPWNARARDWEGAVLNHLEPAGAHRNPTWANLDLLASYRVLLTTRANVQLQGRLLNVFGNQTRLSTDAQQYLDLRTIPTPPYFAEYLQPNPFFGQADAYAPPRRFVLAAVATF
jgi:hypothetical protein